MRILISEEQLKIIVEIVTKKEAICDKCGCNWKLSKGGNDPYICHKCGYNNEIKK